MEAVATMEGEGGVDGGRVEEEGKDGGGGKYEHASTSIFYLFS